MCDALTNSTECRFFFFLIPLKIFPKKVGKMGKRGNSPKIIFYAKNRYKEMPMNKYKTRRPRKTLKRGGSLKKRAVTAAKRKSLVRLIKKVSLRQSETKHTHQIIENVQMYHNVPMVLTSSLLFTDQGMGDTQTGSQAFAMRIGDEVVARGISLKFWIANKLDRPDVIYKIIVFKYRANTTLANADPYVTQGTHNYLIRDLNTEKFQIVKVKNVRISTSAQRITAADTFYGAEGHKAISMWIPLGNQKVKYEDGGNVPLMKDYGVSIVAYDSYGTLTSDNIGSLALNRKFYFKDP